MAGEFLSVPGNIKQIFLPFVLDPGDSINKTAFEIKSGAAAGAGNTQVFSFRKSLGGQGKNALLRIAPNSFYDPNQFAISEDISYRLLYGQDPSAKGSISPYTDILDNLPRISIREYLQDAKLDQIMNFFGAVGSSFSSGAEKGEADRNGGGSIAQGISAIGKSIMNGITGGSVLIKNIGMVMDDILGETCDKATMKTSGSLNENYKRFVLQIPYLLYYKILSATSTNIYEIPYSGQVMYDSNGLNGWTASNALDAGNIAGSGESFIGGLAKFLGKNIKLNSTPTWDGAQDEFGTKAEIEFSLFNDSIEGAVKNFIFVNTIIPGNMWMQYHVFQHAPNLYDIRIEGIKRLFMCAADFKVDYAGVLRKPSKAFCKELAKYINKSCVKLDQNQLEDLVKIPDVYKVTGSFTSLLPNNFNNYLYTYYNNDKIKKLSGTALHEESILDTAMDKAKKEIYAIFKKPDDADQAFKGKEKVKTPPGRLDELIKKIEKEEAEEKAKKEAAAKAEAEKRLEESIKVL